MPEATLLAFADHGAIESSMPADGGYAEAVIDEFRREGVDNAALAEELQRDGVAAFARSWHSLLASIQGKCANPLVAASA